MRTKSKMGIDKREKQAGRGEVARRERTGRAEVVLRPEIFRTVNTRGHRQPGYSQQGSSDRAQQQPAARGYGLASASSR